MTSLLLTSWHTVMAAWTTLDIPSGDQRVLETSILILRVEGGVVREIWSEMSDLQLVMQLGAFPVPDGSR